MNKQNIIFNDIVKLRRLDKHNDLLKYEDAENSYMAIFNRIMTRGKNELPPQNISGKPITLSPDNFSALLATEYYIGAKAKGQRFLMMFSDGLNSEEIEREIYFINFIESNIYYWCFSYVENGIEKSLPPVKNIAHCLIDGEIIMSGLIKEITNENNEIIEYQLKSYGNYSAFISFLSFDILYGPIEIPPIDPKRHKVVYTTSVPMIGFKAIDNWPTYKRREILEFMFLNRVSELTQFNNYQLRNNNFMILVNPFHDFKTISLMLNKINKPVYEFIKDLYVDENSKESVGAIESLKVQLNNFSLINQSYEQNVKQLSEEIENYKNDKDLINYLIKNIAMTNTGILKEQQVVNIESIKNKDIKYEIYMLTHPNIYFNSVLKALDQLNDENPGAPSFEDQMTFYKTNFDIDFSRSFKVNLYHDIKDKNPEGLLTGLSPLISQYKKIVSEYSSIGTEGSLTIDIPILRKDLLKLGIQLNI